MGWQNRLSALWAPQQNDEMIWDFGLAIKRDGRIAQLLTKRYIYYTFIGMEFVFEFDPAKSEANKAKHGIDFVEAQELWRDPRGVTAVVRSETESRYAATAQIKGKYWTAIYTWRGDIVRLISARRARELEIENYEDNYRRRIR